MEGHIYNAAAIGMEYIRFTDHDTRTGRKKKPVFGFDFSVGELVCADGERSEYGWRSVGDAELAVSDNAMSVTVPKKSGTAGAEFFSTGKRHTVSLIAGVVLILGMRIDVNPESRVVLDIRLSQRPPEFKSAHLKYIIGKAPGRLLPYTAIKQLSASDDGIYVLPLSEDIADMPEIGGLDNVFDSVSLLIEGGGNITVDRFEIKVEDGFDGVIRKQRVIADRIGERYGVKPFVTTEISDAGQHKNCWSESVPVIDYFARGYNVTEEEAIAHVRAHGGCFSYNHPFEAPRYKRRDFTEEQIKEIVEYASRALAECGVYGAISIEVGFPEGRGAFSLENYLTLWDNLSLSGVFITGIGDSDSHHNDRGWFSGNNFATWHGVDKRLPFPIPLEVFNDALRAGRAYFGDPVRLRGGVSFTADGWEMGSVLTCEGERTVTARFVADGLNTGARVRVIINGRIFFETSVAEDGRTDLNIPLNAALSVNFARVEVYDTDGRCILLTNPLYLVDTLRFGGSIPEERRQPTREIKVPKEALLLKGRCILHISDTATRDFPAVEALIRELRPSLILHTGDMVDEVKAGRIPEARAEYTEKLGVLAHILNAAEAELLIVPGNNDLADEISRLMPQARVLKKNSVVEIDGVECRVGHQVGGLAFDRRWCFYGHGYTGDAWDPQDNDAERHMRLNGCETYHICIPSAGKCFALPHKFLL